MKSHPLKVERELRGWSQSKVADLLGTTTRSIIRWEQGEVMPYAFYREQLCTIFGKTAQQLGLAPDSPQQNPHEDEDKESMQIELKLPPETSMSSSPSRLPQEEFLLDPTIPKMLGRSESLLGRDLLLTQIKHRLLEADSPPLTALHGLPGIGKTALALALASDPQIQARFYDGILWAELGLQPNVIRQLARWGMLLGIPPSQVGNLHSREDWAKTLQAMIGQRNLLLVIDDAWMAEDALAFRVGGPYCTHLLTTRLPQVALAFAGKNIIPVPELEEADGLTLLARCVPQLIQEDPEGARALVRATGGLPLGLTLIGKYLAVHALTQQPRRLQAALAKMHDTKQRLRVSVPIAPAERTANLPTDIPPSLYTAIAASDQQLSPQAHAALCALAVFPPKPANFSEEAVLAVTQQPVEILDELWDAGLLEGCGTGRYTLHQIVVDYARALSEGLADQEPLVSKLARKVQKHKEKAHIPEYDTSLHRSLWDVCRGLSRSVSTFRPFSRLSWPLLLIVSMMLSATLVGIVVLPIFNRHVTTRSIADLPSTIRIIATSGTSYEAVAPENTLAGGARVLACPVCIGKGRVGYIGKDGILQFNNVRERSTGNYRLVIYYIYGGSSHRNLHLKINGRRGPAFQVLGTGSWQSIGIYRVTISLNAGNNTIEFSNPFGFSPDIDRIVV